MQFFLIFPTRLVYISNQASRYNVGVFSKLKDCILCFLNCLCSIVAICVFMFARL